jgi:hypothetical protein
MSPSLTSGCLRPTPIKAFGPPWNCALTSRRSAFWCSPSTSAPGGRRRCWPVAGAEVVEAWFDQGVIRRRRATAPERRSFLAALGLREGDLNPDDEVVVMSPGRERLLIPVADPEVLAGLRPDQRRLAAASRDFDQLGCFVYAPLTPAGRAPARMFAPAIGVPEDVANANSTGCLAAHLLATGRNPVVAVDQGDAAGRLATVRACATWLGDDIATGSGERPGSVTEPGRLRTDRGATAGASRSKTSSRPWWSDKSCPAASRSWEIRSGRGG